MKDLKKENYIEYLNEYKKPVEYTGVSFEYYGGDDDLIYSVEQTFYRDGFSYDHIDRQIREYNGEFYLFQIPLDDRKYGLVRGSVSIEVGGFLIVDDSNGNLYLSEDVDETELIGNVFYNSGCIFITSNNNFFDTTTNIFSEFGNTTTINFKKYVVFNEKNIIIPVKQNDYRSSTNESWNTEVPIHFNEVLLYNEDFEVIAVGKLSRNTPLINNITLLLESIEVY